MSLAEILILLDDRKLEEFSWGPSIAGFINSFLAENHEIALGFSRKEIIMAMASMSDHTRDIVNSARFDIDKGTVYIPVGKNAVVKQCYKDTEPDIDPTLDFGAVLLNPMSATAIIVVALVLMSATMLLNSITGDGAMPLSKLVDLIVTLFGV